MTGNRQAALAEHDIVRHIGTMAYGEAIGVMRKLADEFNPTLKSILKVEELFQKHIEFDSKSQLVRRLEGSMKPSVLNVILAKLVMENKIMINDDRSLTWIYATNNGKLKKSWKRARPL